MTTESESEETSKQVDRQPKRFILKEEFPFNSDVKLMSTVYVDQDADASKDEHIVVFLKGAVCGTFILFSIIELMFANTGRAGS